MEEDKETVASLDFRALEVADPEESAVDFEDRELADPDVVVLDSEMAEVLDEAFAVVLVTLLLSPVPSLVLISVYWLDLVVV